jgi:hypothetical protein
VAGDDDQSIRRATRRAEKDAVHGCSEYESGYRNEFDDEKTLATPYRPKTDFLEAVHESAEVNMERDHPFQPIIFAVRSG